MTPMYTYKVLTELTMTVNLIILEMCHDKAPFVTVACARPAYVIFLRAPK